MKKPNTFQLGIKPLTINRAYKGRRYKTRLCKNYEKYLALLLPKKVEIFPCMEITVTWGFTNSNSDVDNPVKLFLDALQRKYKFNDRSVYKLVLIKEVTKEPFIKFNIKEYKIQK